MPIANRPIVRKQGGNPFGPLMALLASPLGKFILETIFKGKDGKDTGIGKEWVGEETEPRPTNVPVVPNLPPQPRPNLTQAPPAQQGQIRNPGMPPAPPIEGGEQARQNAMMQVLLRALQGFGKGF